MELLLSGRFWEVVLMWHCGRAELGRRPGLEDGEDVVFHKTVLKVTLFPLHGAYIARSNAQRLPELSGNDERDVCTIARASMRRSRPLYSRTKPTNRRLRVDPCRRILFSRVPWNGESTMNPAGKDPRSHEFGFAVSYDNPKSGNKNLVSARSRIEDSWGVTL